MQPPSSTENTEIDVNIQRRSRSEDFAETSQAQPGCSQEVQTIQSGRRLVEEEIEQVELEEKRLPGKKKTSLTSSFKKRFRFPTVYHFKLTHNFCKAQSQLQFNWTELALFSFLTHPTPHTRESSDLAGKGLNMFSNID